tara:strand:+ start:1689 stop:2417 length:729 start_codon:yes stop_codon:yes gene_type:complete
LTTIFTAISDEFLADLTAITELISIAQAPGNSARSRIASVNSSTLLLAARFEEFIRELGRQFARETVSRCGQPSQIPRKLTATAWKRTLEGLARAKIDTGGTPEPTELISRQARSSFEAVCSFLEGDTTQDIYESLIHNDNNMRPAQLNAVFSICDLKDVCLKTSARPDLSSYFEEDDPGKVHGLLLVRLNDFMEKRNDIAHSLNPGSSSVPDNVLDDVSFFKALALSLAETLPEHLPQATG